MDRPIIQTGEIPRSQDFLFGAQQAMVGLSKLAEAMFGTSTVALGLDCTPTSPATMDVEVGAGQIYQSAALEPTAYGVIAADTAHTVLKQGVLLDPAQLSCPAPTTSGYSIQYLIEAQFSEQDQNDLVVPFYNSANPASAYSGPGNSGSTIPTQRNGLCNVQVKAGVAAATGSETTPSVDSGYVGLYVVTVPYGATALTSSNISTYPGAPLLNNILGMTQSSSFNVATDTGTANAYVVALTPTPSALTDGFLVRMRALNNCTGPSTLNVNGIGAKSIYLPYAGTVAVALIGTEIIANGTYDLVYNSARDGFILLNPSSNARVQGDSSINFSVANATSPQHAIALAQLIASFGASSGYLSLPNGFILQWGTFSGTAIGSGQGTLETVALPINFPTGALIAMANSPSGLASVAVGATGSGSQCVILYANSDSISLSITGSWFVLGH